MGPGHPDAPRRLALIEDQLLTRGITEFLRHFDAPEATREQLKRVHAVSYLDSLEAISPVEGRRQIDPDTSMNPYTLEAARRAAGAVVLATDLVVRGDADNAFCAVRPPGHHATWNAAMGFCFINNVAVGVAQALAVHGLKRIAILDFDVHHGNGTESIFWREGRVLVCSAYQYPLYPFSGAPSVPGRIVNVELPAGARGHEYRHAVDQHWLTAIDAFRPEMIFVSAGFDAHADDPTADLLLNDRDFEWLGETILSLARRHAQGRLVSCLEGGYAADTLARCVARHVQILAGI
jgi:acetoin utilization deacetylase AcuC-like enzyme